MGLCHILDTDGRTPICVDFETCAEWLGSHNSNVAATTIRYDLARQEAIRVSTIFVPFDTADSEHPRLFETMVFGGQHGGATFRWPSWEEAERGHTGIVAALFRGAAP
jgi:hypothetical protein